MCRRILSTIFSITLLLLPLIALCDGGTKHVSIEIFHQDTSHINLLNSLFNEYRKTDPSKALEFAIEASTKAKKIEFQKGLAEANYNLGRLYSDQSQYNKSEFHLGLAQENWSKLKHQDESKAVNYLGIINSKLGNYSSALDYFLEALQIREKNNDTKGIASSLNNIGNVHYWQQDLDKAIFYYRKSLQIKLNLSQQKSAASSYNNIGNIYEEKGQWKKAMQEYQKSLELKLILKDTLGISSSYNNIGSTYMNLDQLDSSLFYFHKAYSLQKKVNDLSGQINTLINIGHIHFKQQHLDLAVEELNNAISLGEQINIKPELKEAHSLLKDIYTYQNDTKNALKNYESFIMYKDSIYNEESENHIAELEVKYKTAKQKSQLLEANKSVKEKNILWAISSGIAIILLMLAIIYFTRLKTKQKINGELLGKNKIIRKKNEQIIDSISYASRIQKNCLTKDDYLKKCFSDYFVLYEPKDIVSGDFYWTHQLADGSTIFTGADCTGHGVPGGFMSMIGVSLLNEIVVKNNITDLPEIMNQLSDGIIHALKQDSESGTMDGMDMTICKLDPSKRNLEIAGARNSALVFQNGVLNDVKTTQKSVGFNPSVFNNIKFTSTEIKVNSGDMIYLLSDGYYDQVGGSQRKKYLISRLKKVLISIHSFPPKDQKEILINNFQDWKGDHKQLDDVLVFGIKI